MDPRDALEQLAHDREHGASEITQRALPALTRLAQQAEDPIETVAEQGAGLIEAQPAMASLVSLVDAVLTRLDEGKQPSAVREALERERENRARALALAGAARIQDKQRVAVYSRSGTVLSALRTAKDRGGVFEVLTSEARPGNEGVEVARLLAGDGFEVTLVTDAGLGERLAWVDVLLVGADALCQAGLVNKVGTGVLLWEADRVGVPGLVLAGTGKVLPASYREKPSLGVTGSMGHDLPDGVREVCPLFECVRPPEGQLVVTEQGAWRWSTVEKRAEGLALHPSLAGRLSGV